MRTQSAVLILILAGIAAYANTAKNGLFWDDDEFITRNAYIRSFRYLPQWFSQPLTAGAGVNSNYYRPLLTLSFAVDYKLWGLWPAGYHLENMLWHIAAAILLYFFLKELLAPAVAFAASLLWLVHPVHVEAVAYANSRGDSMATAFILLTLILWMKRRVWASSATFVLALLSKEFAIVTPGLIALIEFMKARPSDGRPGPFRLKRIVPHFIIAAIYLFLRLTVLNFQNTLNFYGVDLSRADRSNPMAVYAASLPTRLMTFLRVLPIYGRILVWPNDLYMERTVEIASEVMDPTALTVSGILAIIFLFAVFKGPALRRKAGPYQIFAFASGWFFISILPVSGVIPISQILAEHFLYLPSIGFFLIFSWLIITLVSKIIKTEKWQRVSLFFVFCSLLIALVSKTIRQNRVWRDPITFYEYTLAHAKPTARVYNNLAMAYADRGNHQKAIDNYQLAISLGDVYPNPHYNLGNTLMEMERLDEAEKEYRRALEIDPSFHYATLKLGQMYLDQGNIEEAKTVVCPVFPTQPLCRKF